MTDESEIRRGIERAEFVKKGMSYSQIYVKFGNWELS